MMRAQPGLRKAVGVAGLLGMFGLGPRAHSGPGSLSTILRSLDRISVGSISRRRQDRSKYEPHQGKREKLRRRMGGFYTRTADAWVD